MRVNDARRSWANACGRRFILYQSCYRGGRNDLQYFGCRPRRRIRHPPRTPHNTTTDSAFPGRCLLIFNSRVCVPQGEQRWSLLGRYRFTLVIGCACFGKPTDLRKACRGLWCGYSPRAIAMMSALISLPGLASSMEAILDSSNWKLRSGAPKDPPRATTPSWQSGGVVFFLAVAPLLSYEENIVRRVGLVKLHVRAFGPRDTGASESTVMIDQEFNLP